MMPDLFKDKEHLIRMAGLFAVGLAVFVLARGVLVPADFGTYGHFRGGALDDNRGRPLRFVGRAADPESVKPVRPDAKTVCFVCHVPNVAKPRGFPQVDPHEHGDSAACNSCHQPHHPEV